MKVETIAHWFIEQLDPTSLKLQSLLYFAQGNSFCMSDKELFPEDFEIIDNQMIIPYIYQHYMDIPNIKYDTQQIDNDTISVLKYIKDKYAKYEEDYLLDCVKHQPPFLYTQEELKLNPNNTVVAKELIYDYFISSMLYPKIEEWDS